MGDGHWNMMKISFQGVDGTKDGAWYATDRNGESSFTKLNSFRPVNIDQGKGK